MGTKLCMFNKKKNGNSRNKAHFLFLKKTKGFYVTKAKTKPFYHFMTSEAVQYVRLQPKLFN